MHESHRDRLRERFLSEGLEAFDPHQALELLLFYAIPRHDTNELAHRLISRFGSVAGVLDADPAEIEQFEGLGRRSSILLAMMKPMWRLYRRESARIGPAMDNFKAACDFAADLFAGRTNEAFYVLCLDPGCRLIRAQLLCEGTVNEVSVHPRTVVETVLRSNASQIILMHNHPKGMLDPSPDDVAYTRRLTVACLSIGIDIVDHIIVSGEETYSFAREGRMETIIKEAKPSITGMHPA